MRNAEGESGRGWSTRRVAIGNSSSAARVSASTEDSPLNYAGLYRSREVRNVSVKLSHRQLREDSGFMAPLAIWLVH